MFSTILIVCLLLLLLLGAMPTWNHSRTAAICPAADWGWSPSYCLS
jgi:hypothetical protein